MELSKKQKELLEKVVETPGQSLTNLCTYSEHYEAVDLAEKGLIEGRGNARFGPEHGVWLYPTEKGKSLLKEIEEKDNG